MGTKKVTIIGSGFAGLSAACFLAKTGYKVLVLEKHAQPGGRARQLKIDGFSFDMGPSWYWMPEVFENFFNAFGRSAADYYQIKRLDPSYRVFTADAIQDIPADLDSLLHLFESLETGAGDKLREFLTEAEYKYEVGMGKLVYQPGLSLRTADRHESAQGGLRGLAPTDESPVIRRWHSTEWLPASWRSPPG